MSGADVRRSPIVTLCCNVLSGEHEEGISEEADEYRSISSSLQPRAQRPPEEVCPGSAERTVRTERVHYLDLRHLPRSIVGP